MSAAGAGAPGAKSSDPLSPEPSGAPAPVAAVEALRARILAETREFARARWAPREFQPGQDDVPVSGRVFDDDDVASLVEASLDFWLTTGRFADRFEKEFAGFMGAREAFLVNSGSSANLCAVTVLTSPLLKDRALKPGDEVLTAASGFPTTVNPIIQNRLVPVFVDSLLPGYNADPERLAAAVSPRTKAVILAHTLGNPFDLAAVTALAAKHKLWLIEDCCDAAGARFGGKPAGSFGDLATVSFYPAHQITMGEGGAVLLGNPDFKRIVESIRDWGRDCWCAPGKENTCLKRFEWQLGDLPFGYDHKYIYSHIGYNMKATDMQAAVGVSQLKKLPGFIRRRQENFDYLRAGLAPLEEFLVLPEPTPGSTPSWFGFALTVREGAPFDRLPLIRFLEDRRIRTRLFFGGNLVRQPAYRDVEKRVAGPLDVADRIMNRSFWIGVYPGLTRPMLDYMISSIKEFAAKQ